MYVVLLVTVADCLHGCLLYSLKTTKINRKSLVAIPRRQSVKSRFAQVELEDRHSLGGDNSLWFWGMR